MKLVRNEILYRNSFILIELNYDEDCMCVNWRGYVSHHDVMAGCMEILRLVKEHKVVDILNDNTYVEGMWSGAAKWGGEFWFPALREAGLQRFAWIYSPSMLSRLSTDKTIKHTPTPDYIKTFDDIEEAKDWLRTTC
ncbi:STAS/SEC14 domain-containing protein [Pontibacter toksunensis]|uniref:STAS/SEC14 domain-containing protein n=1 Tax=Pontibacter toksunensis TaxID=1332631 RepID=A0ABW6BNW4_9BACT